MNGELKIHVTIQQSLTATPAPGQCMGGETGRRQAGARPGATTGDDKMPETRAELDAIVDGKIRAAFEAFAGAFTRLHADDGATPSERA